MIHLGRFEFGVNQQVFGVGVSTNRGSVKEFCTIRWETGAKKRRTDKRIENRRNVHTLARILTLAMFEIAVTIDKSQKITSFSFLSVFLFSSQVDALFWLCSLRPLLGHCRSLSLKGPLHTELLPLAAQAHFPFLWCVRSADPFFF